jgi:ribosomal protein L11 methyltransferase
MAVTPVGEPRAGDHEVDHAVRVTLPPDMAEVAGAVLMDLLGPYEIEDTGLEAGGADSQPRGDSGATVTLVFYPGTGASPQAPLSAADVFAMLPPAVAGSGRIGIELRDVARDWVDGWKDHFRPIVVAGVRIRPPWEQALEASGESTPGGAGRGGTISRRRPPVDVVINPGLGFGTGLHPTTRGTLQLLQLAGPHSPSARRKVSEPPRQVAARTGGNRSAPESRRLVDAGTGSGILAVAAAKLGWDPVTAFDNDPVALTSARENVEANAVAKAVQVHEADVAGAPVEWFAGATVLANMTLEPVLTLVRKVGPAGAGPRPLDAPAVAVPVRLVVSGILAGEQECELVRAAAECGFSPGRRLYEAGWVAGGPVTGGPSSGLGGA